MLDLEYYASCVDEECLSWWDAAYIPAMYYMYRKEHDNKECVEEFVIRVILKMYTDNLVYQAYSIVEITEEELEETGSICEANKISEIEWLGIKEKLGICGQTTKRLCGIK